MQTPVTILTGFLGSGKTTLLNRILKENHGHRIAVIENEFGEAGIDNELLVQDSDEQIIEMNNGCICCTVRGDLVRILGELQAKKAAGTLHWSTPSTHRRNSTNTMRRRSRWALPTAS